MPTKTTRRPSVAPPERPDLEHVRLVWPERLTRRVHSVIAFACRPDADPRAVAREVRAWLEWYQSEQQRRTPNRGGRPRKLLRGANDMVESFARDFARVWRSARLAVDPMGTAAELGAAFGMTNAWPDTAKTRKVLALLKRAHPEARNQIRSPLRLAREVVAVVEGVSVATVKAHRVG